MSPAAWQGFSLLRSLLDPFQRAMEGVMARTATVAEVARQWLRLAAALNAEAAALDPGPSPRMIPSRDAWGGRGPWCHCLLLKLCCVIWSTWGGLLSR